MNTSFGRQNWFPYVQEEQKAARQGVAMIDYTMLGKLMVEGKGAESFLQRVCTNDMALANGRVCLYFDAERAWRHRKRCHRGASWR